jgi:hypothetical protein
MGGEAVRKAPSKKAARKEVHIADDPIRDLRSIREILRKQRRVLVAKMVSAKKEPTKFTPLIQLQQACDAVEWALDDEASAAKETEKRTQPVVGKED